MTDSGLPASQEVQDEFWVFRQLLNDNECLPPVIAKHLDGMRHRIVGKIRVLEKELDALPRT